MKSENTILVQIHNKNEELKKLEKTKHRFSNTDLESGYAEQVIENINILKGEIKSLEWVLDY